MRSSLQYNFDRIYLGFSRLYFALKQIAFNRILNRWPRLESTIRRLRRSLNRGVVPRRRLWLQVESGLSKGLWMHLQMPDGAAFWRGEHERDIQDLLLTVVKPGDCIYDIGAEIGSFALGIARLVGESGCVVAFEADPENISTLNEHRIRNQLQHELRVVHAAVWSHTTDDQIAFRLGKGRSHGGVEANGHAPILAHGEIIYVPVITLDGFIAAGGPEPQIIKIDVEGGEAEVLRGGLNLFANRRPSLIVEVHHQKAADEIRAWLQEVHYSGQWNAIKEGSDFPQHLVAHPTELKQLNVGRNEVKLT